MRVRHYSLPHWCWQKWHLYFFNELSHLLLYPSICHSLTNDNQGFMSEPKHIESFLDLRKRWTKSSWLGINWYFDVSFNHLIEYISRKIEKYRAWPSGSRESDCLINMVGDVFG